MRWLGEEHSLIVTADGRPWRCGRNQCAQLATGNPQACRQPQAPLDGVRAVAASAGHNRILRGIDRFQSLSLPA